MIDALSRQVPLMLGNVLATLPHVRAGRLRAFGVTSTTRAAAAPEIPTIAEAGVPGYASQQVRVIREPKTMERFQADGGESTWSKTPDAFGALLRSELVKWAKVVKAAGIKPE